MSATVAVAAAIVLAGWALARPALTTIGAHGVAMNPLTAVCFVLLAAALLISLPAPDSHIESTVARTLALAVTALAVVKLAMLGRPDGPDTWLFRHAVETATPVNRMAPNTAVLLIPVALAVAGLDVTVRRYRPALLLVLVALPLTLAVLVGFLFNVSEVYGWGAYTPMARSTAVSLLLVQLAVITGRVEQGLTRIFVSQSAGGVAIRRLLPAAMIVPFVMGYLRLAGQRRGLYGPEFGTILFTLGMMAVFAALVAWTALDVHRVDVRRVETEVRLQALIRNVPLGIVVLDRDGCVQFCNDAFVEIFHYPAADLAGRRVDDLIAPEKDGGETAALTRRGIAGESLRRTTMRRRRDGTLVAVELYVVPLSMHGRPIGTYGVYRPIGDTRQAGAPRQNGIA